MRSHSRLGSFFSPAPWRATAYLLSYLALGPIMFAFVLVLLVLTAVANITWLGLPVLAGAGVLVRGCATIERARSGLVGPAIVGDYRPVTGNVANRAKTRWTDPATFRDCAYLVLAFPLLMVLDAAVSVAWLSVLGLVTVPAWFWMIFQTWPNGETGHGLMIGHFPNGPGGGGIGVWIGDIGTALVVSVITLAIAALVGAPLVMAAARLRVRLTNRLLGPAVDPLAAAKKILAGPGPLPAVTSRAVPRRR